MDWEKHTNPLCNVMTSYCHRSHIIGNNDFTWEFPSDRSVNIFWPCDLDLWPTTLTYNPNLAKVKVNYHTKNQGRRSLGSAVRVFTHTDTDTQTHTQKDGSNSMTSTADAGGKNDDNRFSCPVDRYLVCKYIDFWSQGTILEARQSPSFIKAIMIFS